MAVKFFIRLRVNRKKKAMEGGRDDEENRKTGNLYDAAELIDICWAMHVYTRYLGRLLYRG